MRKIKYVSKKSWEQFRSAGLLWFINSILHLFGWAIVFDYEKGEKTIKEVYPARCKFRGFDLKNNTEGYKKVTKYLKNNINDLEKETLL